MPTSVQLTIDELPAIATATRQHALAAMKDGLGGKLTVGQILDLVIGAAPGQLDTLDELAAALADDANFAATVTAALALKASLTGVETLTNKTLTAPVLNSPAVVTPSGEFIRGRFSGLVWSNSSGDVTNDFTLSAGWAASDGAVPEMMVLAAAMTKRTDAAWSAGNNGGCWLDGASMPNGTGHIFIMRNPTTQAVDIGASASLSPTLPSGYTQKFRACSCVRESAAVVAVEQLGNYFARVPKIERDSTAALAATTITLGVPVGLKVRPRISTQFVLPASSNIAVSVGSGGAGSANTLIQTGFTGTSEADSAMVESQAVITNTSGQIWLEVVIGGGSITLGRLRTLGWEDPRQ
ncbi:hypothetical protein ACCS52_26575 [Rhizobium ruizarguesonis]